MRPRRTGSARISTRLTIALVSLIGMVLVSGLVSASTIKAATDIAYDTSLAHFAPFSDTLFRSRVKVTIDGSTVSDDLRYMEVIPNLSLQTGAHQIMVDPLEWPGTTLSQSIDIPLPPTGMRDPGAVLAIAGGTSDIPLSVFVQLIELEPPTSGVEVRLTHLAPYSLGGESDYTLCNADGTVFYNMGTVSYGGSTPYIDIPAGRYPVYLAGGRSSCSERLMKDLYLQFEDGSVGDLYAVGSNANNSPAFHNSLTVVSESTIVMSEEVYLPLQAH